MNRYFPEIQKNFGFGFMRLPEVDEKINLEATCPVVDAFMDAGFNYFDTAHPYHHGQSEAAIRECVVSRYDRSQFVLANKLSGFCFETLKEVEPLFQLQLELLTEGSPASYAIRYAAGFDGVTVVLSGMSNEEHVGDNISFMKEFMSLSDKKQEIISRVRTMYQAQHRIPCTACRYCVDGCPAGISIPDVFACMNQKLAGEGEPEKAYEELTVNAACCVECGQCERVCPQNLHIRELLKEVDAAFG